MSGEEQIKKAFAEYNELMKKEKKDDDYIDSKLYCVESLGNVKHVYCDLGKPFRDLIK